MVWRWYINELIKFYQNGFKESGKQFDKRIAKILYREEATIENWRQEGTKILKKRGVIPKFKSAQIGPSWPIPKKT